MAEGLYLPDGLDFQGSGSGAFYPEQAEWGEAEGWGSATVCWREWAASRAGLKSPDHTEKQVQTVPRDDGPSSLRHQGCRAPPPRPLPPVCGLGTCQAVGNILPSLLFQEYTLWETLRKCLFPRGTKSSWFGEPF